MTLTAKESERAYIEAPDAIERIVSQTSSRRDGLRRLFNHSIGARRRERQSMGRERVSTCSRLG